MTNLEQPLNSSELSTSEPIDDGDTKTHHENHHHKRVHHLGPPIVTQYEIPSSHPGVIIELQHSKQELLYSNKRRKRTFFIHSEIISDFFKSMNELIN